MGVTEPVLRVLHDMPELERAADLLADIWGYPTGQLPVTPELLRALAHSGNYVSGAWVDRELVGASAGWLGRHDGAVFLHSHISGVATAHQGMQIGFLLKQHQREWALDHAITIVEWTFDPLIRRNAYFNLSKLRALIVGYAPDFYGAMRDATNAGEETDRAVVRWDLDSPARRETSTAEAPVILSPDDGGRPVVERSEAPVLRAWVPEDYVRDRAALAGWRQAVRESLGAALRDGYVATDMSRDGWYTLVRNESWSSTR